MFIGLCGLKFSGRSTFATFLHDNYKFTIVRVSSEPSPPGNSNILHFCSVDEMLEWITERWRDDFVWPEVEYFEDFDKIAKRPFFLLIELKSRVSDRFIRSGYDKIERLISEDDSQAFMNNGLLQITPHAEFKFLNSSGLEQLAKSLRHLGLSFSDEKKRLTRPEWDAYFMRIAEFAAKRTNCMKRGVGAVLVQEKRIIATGYNGTARGLNNCADGGCSRCNSNAKCGQSLDSCLCLHAEENALLEAGRARATGATLYCTTAPCLSCARKICQMSVARVVYRREYSIEHFTERLCKEAGIILDKFNGNINGSIVINCADEVEEIDGIDEIDGINGMKSLRI